MTGPVAVIAGIPLEVHRRARNHPKRARWTIRKIPSQEAKRADLRSIWRRVMDEVDRAPDSGVHLLLAHDRESERPGFDELTCRCYRATWLSRELSRKYGQTEFLEAFDDFIDFEEAWRNRIRPDTASPLLLPEQAFMAEKSVKDAWSRARNVNRERDDLNAVEKAIKRFSDLHRRHGCWHDRQDLVFSNGAPHGQHGLEPWRRCKFTYCFPEGFHFDVKHSRDRNFSIRSRSGVRDFSVYTNIDPHGFLRGGR